MLLYDIFAVALNHAIAIHRVKHITSPPFVSLEVKELLGGQGKVAKLYARPVEGLRQESQTWQGDP